jgi:hypothetical protein
MGPQAHIWVKTEDLALLLVCYETRMQASHWTAYGSKDWTKRLSNHMYGPAQESGLLISGDLWDERRHFSSIFRLPSLSQFTSVVAVNADLERGWQTDEWSNSKIPVDFRAYSPRLLNHKVKLP